MAGNGVRVRMEATPSWSDRLDMLEQGESPREMRIAIDAAYASQIELSTPTPYPPSQAHNLGLPRRHVSRPDRSGRLDAGERCERPCRRSRSG